MAQNGDILRVSHPGNTIVGQKFGAPGIYYNGWYLVFPGGSRKDKVSGSYITAAREIARNGVTSISVDYDEADVIVNAETVDWLAAWGAIDAANAAQVKAAFPVMGSGGLLKMALLVAALIAISGAVSSVAKARN